MKKSILAAAFALGLCTPALAQSENIWEPCLSTEPSMEGLIAAFQADGWTFPGSNEEHIGNLQTVAEPLFALQALPDVETAAGFERHIAAAHARAEPMLMDAATMQRDGLVVAIESDDAGGMIRCTFAGNEFEEVAYAFDGGDTDINTVGGHEVITVAVPEATSRTDVTLYRLIAPADASVEARATFAAIAIRHVQ